MLAIDPSSAFTGGAILGDRVRMQAHDTDSDVFIRSMATRGHLGGLSRSTPQAIAVLEAAGYPWVLVETVGVGQVEVAVAGAADTVVVVVNPGWGDGVQASKAGLLEIGDVFVVNKADRDGCARDPARSRVDALARGFPRVASADRRDRGDRRHRRRRAVERDRGAPRPSRADPTSSCGGVPVACAKSCAASCSNGCSPIADATCSGAAFDQLVEQVAARDIDAYTAVATLLDNSGGKS